MCIRDSLYTNLDPCGSLESHWTPLGPSTLFGTTYSSSGPHLDPYTSLRTVQGNLDPLRPCKTELDPSGPLIKPRKHIWSLLYQLDPSMSGGTPLDQYGPLYKRWDPSGSYGELYSPQDPSGHLFVPSDLPGCLEITFIYWDPSYLQSLWTPLDPIVALWNYWVPLHPLDPSIFIALDLIKFH